MYFRHGMLACQPLRRSAALVMGLMMWTVAGPVAGDKPVVFNRDIRPILSNNCFFCHGPDPTHREADLRLDVRDEALDFGAIVPGQPDHSELMARILSDDPDLQMPPPESNKTLTAEQKELLKRWVAEGAGYQGHWAYEKPVKPEIPQGADPIDYLVEQQLDAQGLERSPEADRRTLARRLYFDLLGLPPTPQEIEAFVNDPSPGAYARLVDKALASPHYGERMAIGWLDVVRFADTIGYHSDTPRNVWPYRDYVIRAFNQNKPFDQFTIEQLAGDLLPDSTQQQKVASCFNRLLLSTEEGGAQAKDYEARMLTDRVRAVGAVWLGQTLGCAQCHDHKFDPSTMQDFYSMGAFFADIQEPIIGRREPGMLTPDEEQAAELARRQQAAAGLQRQLDTGTPERAEAQRAWEQAVQQELGLADRWNVLQPEQVTSEKGVQFKIEDHVVLADRNPQGGADTYRVTVKTTLQQITGFRLDVLPHPSLPQQGPGRAANGNFVLSDFQVTRAEDQAVPLSHASATYQQPGFPAAAVLDGQAGKGSGWAVAGASGVENALCVELDHPVGDGQELTLVFTLQQQQGDNHTLGRFRLSATTADKPIRAPRAVIPPREIVEIVQADPAQRNDAQQAKLAEHFKNAAPELAGLRKQLADAKQAVTDYEATLPRCLVSVSMGNPRTVRILPRGDWMDDSGPVVQPALPHYLPQPEDLGDRRLTRLDLAQWIASADNPLTARVFVNRLWKQFFGVGLCKTLDDFGSQGEWPVYPELLDWLACEFVDSGWDVKHLVRTIVLSRTYRQVSTAPESLRTRDPENRLLARQSRFRMDAELVRDNALAVSGLLVPKLGGPSVKPYQPAGYWENLNFPTRRYEASTGEDQYRRGVYTWWQRSFLHPSMLAFDAPTREECAADRSRSNIPQQALVLLNDPSYVEAARALAARILRHGGSHADARLDWAWQQVLQRPPRDDERRAAKELAEKHQAQFAEDMPAAQQLLQVGLAPVPQDLDPAELAAWTNVARILLNLHETITRN